MPTGTRSNISPNNTTNPRLATTSLLTGSLAGLDLVLRAELVRLEDQPIGTDGDQQHRRDVTEPRHEEKRPHRQPQVEGQKMIGARGPDLVVEGVGLHRDDEQKDERGEDVDEALRAPADIGIEQVDGDVGAAI